MQTTNKNRFSFAMIFALIAALSFSMVACNDDDSSDEVILESFGPSPVALGSPISFIGQNLDKVSSIEFPMGYEVSQFEEKTPGKIVVMATRDTAMAYEGFVILHTSKGDITTKTKIGYAQSALIDAITPEVKPGGELTISGSYLSSVQSVILAGNVVIPAENFTSMTNGVIKVIVPAEAKSGNVQVFDGTYYVYSEQALKVTLPSCSAISKSEDVYPGKDEITISGADFDLLKAVRFSNGQELAAADIEISDNAIKFTCPEYASAGEVSLVALSGEAASAGEITVLAPVVTTLDPDNGLTKANIELVAAGNFWCGDEITIAGQYMDLIETVNVGGKEASIVSADENSIVIKVSPEAEFAQYPNGSWPMAAPVSMVATSGADIAAAEAADGFYVLAPWVNWANCGDPSVYSLGGESQWIGMAYSNMLDKLFINDVEVEFTADPANTWGVSVKTDVTLATYSSVSITAQYKNGSKAAGSASIADVPEYPIISVLPADKIMAGSLITIQGANFAEGTKITLKAEGLEDVALDVAVSNSKVIYAKIPGSAPSADWTVVVSNSKGSSEAKTKLKTSSAVIVYWEGEEAFQSQWSHTICVDCGLNLKTIPDNAILKVYFKGASVVQWIGIKLQDKEGANLGAQMDFQTSEGDFVIEIPGTSVKNTLYNGESGTDWTLCGGSNDKTVKIVKVEVQY